MKILGGIDLRTSNVLLFSLLVVLFASCKMNYRLSKEDMSRIPYRVNDKLTFFDEEGRTYLLIINKEEKQTSRVNPYAGILSKTTESYVLYFRAEGSPEDLILLALGKKQDNRTFINFFFEYPGHLTPHRPIYLDELDQLPVQEKVIFGKRYKDLILLPESDYQTEVDLPIIRNVLWSKASGIVRFENSDGKVFILR